MSDFGITAACRAAGVSRDPVYKRLQRGLTLAEAIAEVRTRHRSGAMFYESRAVAEIELVADILRKWRR